MLDPVVIWLIAAGGALLFGTACLHKLHDWRRFVATLTNYRVLPAALSLPAGWLIVVLEGATAVGLLWPPTRQLCCLVGAMLLVLYATSIALNLTRGRRGLDCGCSLRPRPIRGAMIVRNSVIAVILLFAALPSTDRPWVWLDGLTLTAALAVATLLYISLDTLLETQWTRS
jgi:hypothetical protein